MLGNGSRGMSLFCMQVHMGFIDLHITCRNEPAPSVVYLAFVLGRFAAAASTTVGLTLDAEGTGRVMPVSAGGLTTSCEFARFVPYNPDPHRCSRAFSTEMHSLILSPLDPCWGMQFR